MTIVSYTERLNARLATLNRLEDARGGGGKIQIYQLITYTTSVLWHFLQWTISLTQYLKMLISFLENPDRGGREAGGRVEEYATP